MPKFKYRRENKLSLNKELLDLLVCPACKDELELTAEEDGLICRACGQVYPIIDEIPVMLIPEAVPLAEWEHKRPCAQQNASE